MTGEDTRRDLTRRRPDGGINRSRSILGFRWRRLDLRHGGVTFLRRRGIEHPRLGGLLVHWIDGPDPGLDLHDHPWSFVTLVLRGGYTEEANPIRTAARAAEVAETTDRIRTALGIPDVFPFSMTRGTVRSWPRWSIHRMGLDVAHRITDVEPGTVTLVLRRPRRRRWGFYMRHGWVDWEDYDYETRRPCSVDPSKPEERTL